MSDSQLRALIMRDPHLRDRIEGMIQTKRHGEGGTAEDRLTDYMPRDVLAATAAGNATIFAAIRSALTSQDGGVNDVANAIESGLEDSALEYAILTATKQAHGIA